MVMDLRLAAAMVQKARRDIDSTAHRVLTVNMIWTVFEFSQAIDKDDIELSDIESAKILDELPTGYEQEGG